MFVRDIVAVLDDEFYVARTPPDQPFSAILPALCSKFGSSMLDQTRPAFRDRFNGLTLQMDDHAHAIALSVFPSAEAINEIITRNGRSSLLVTHHPVDIETTGRGFLPIAEQEMRDLERYGISVYVVHNPLDWGARISTRLALMRALGLDRQGNFTREGFFTELDRPMEFDQYVGQIGQALGVQDVRFHRAARRVCRIAVVPGGGLDRFYWEECLVRNVDTFITGEYRSEALNSFGERQRAQFDQFVAGGAPLSFIGGSHYATEAPVLRDELREYLSRKLELNVTFIPQTNPWR